MGNDYPGVICVEWISGYLNTQMMDLTEINPADCVGEALQIINLPPGGHNSIIVEGD